MQRQTNQTHLCLSAFLKLFSWRFKFCCCSSDSYRRPLISLMNYLGTTWRHLYAAISPRLMETSLGPLKNTCRPLEQHLGATFRYFRSTCLSGKGSTTMLIHGTLSRGGRGGGPNKNLNFGKRSPCWVGGRRVGRLIADWWTGRDRLEGDQLLIWHHRKEMSVL